MDIKIPTVAALAAEGKVPEILFWVGCAGSFDERYKNVTKAFVKILNKVGVDFAVLGLRRLVQETQPVGREMTFSFRCRRWLIFKF